MFPVMARYSESGLMQSAFMEAEGLSRSVFQYWWRRYRQSSSAKEPDGFVALEVNEGEMLDRFSQMELILESGLRLRFTGQLPPKHYVVELSRELLRC